MTRLTQMMVSFKEIIAKIVQSFTYLYLTNKKVVFSVAAHQHNMLAGEGARQVLFLTRLRPDPCIPHTEIIFILFRLDVGIQIGPFLY